MNDMKRPSDAAFRRAVEQAGDGCGLCNRKQLWNGEHTTIGFIRGKLVCVGQCCRSRLGTVWGGGIYYGGAENNPPWLDDDRKWFEAHPERSHRLRRSFPGEAVGIMTRWQGNVEPRLEVWPWIVVKQMEKGMRRRAGVELITTRPDITLDMFTAQETKTAEQAATHEAFACELFNARVDGDGYMNEDPIDLRDILSRAIERASRVKPKHEPEVVDANRRATQATEGSGA